MKIDPHDLRAAGGRHLRPLPVLAGSPSTPQRLRDGFAAVGGSNRGPPGHTSDQWQWYCHRPSTATAPSPGIEPAVSGHIGRRRSAAAQRPLRLVGTGRTRSVVCGRKGRGQGGGGAERARPHLQQSAVGLHHRAAGGPVPPGEVRVAEPELARQAQPRARGAGAHGPDGGGLGLVREIHQLHAAVGAELLGLVVGLGVGLKKGLWVGGYVDHRHQRAAVPGPSPAPARRVTADPPPPPFGMTVRPAATAPVCPMGAAPGQGLTPRICQAIA